MLSRPTPNHADAASPAASQPAAAEPILAGLDRGWIMLPRVAIGGPGEAPAMIDVILLHADHGVALLEAPPRWTPDAPARLLRRLDQARFAAIFPGHLPVLHQSLQHETLAALPQLLAEGFEALPPLALPGGDAWMLVVRRVLLRPPDDAEPAAPAGVARPRVRLAKRLAMLALAAGLVLLLRPAIRSGDPAPAGAVPVLGALAEVVAPPEANAAKLPMAQLDPPGSTDAKDRPGHPDLTDPSGTAAGMQDGAPALAADAPSAPAADAPEPAPTLAVAPTPVPVMTPAFPVMANPTPATPPTGLLRRGDALLALGDVSGARRFYERAAEAGSAEGARAAGRTHDPAALAVLGVRGIRPDPEAAAAWYRRADALAPPTEPRR